MIPRVALPKMSDDGDMFSWIMKENAPAFPLHIGCFPIQAN